ncbi:MAG: phosphoribosyltransferase family protein, partial [Pseudomonadota bacterium]
VDQVALLAAAAARLLERRYAPTALLRVKSTPPQQKLSADARKRNVAGAFAVAEEARDLINGAHIVIIDDVLTTGATLSACARAAYRAGAARVDALVLARVVKDGVEAI